MSILKEGRSGALSLEETHRVKLAYGMLAISVFFSPRDKRGPVPRDAYLIAADTMALDNLNWGQYAVTEVLDAARELQESIGNFRPGGFTLHGCQLAVQV
jgi:hypothetical protein